MENETPEAVPAPPPFDPRRRLRELLAIPERDRTDAQWDEINELEIQLAPGNRIPPGTTPGAAPPPRPYPAKKFSGKGDKGGKGRQRPRKPSQS
jgi:hypothetical protein